MEKLIYQIAQLILIEICCIACINHDHLPEPIASPVRSNIYSPAESTQNEYSFWQNTTWVQAGDTLVCTYKLMERGHFNPNSDFLKVYCRELSGNNKPNLAYYTIFYLNSKKKPQANFIATGGQLTKTFYADKFDYYLKFSLLNSTKNVAEINQMGIGFRWFSRK